jgi:diguanylate cyclase (GGDEF)-like protein
MLEVRSQDPELRRKGNVLAIVLLGLMAAGVMLAAINLVRGDTNYNLVNSLFILSVLTLYILNRFGAVRAASLVTVALTAGGALLMSTENVATTYIAMPLPVIIASYLFRSWSAFLVAALMIVGAVVFGIASPSLLVLVVVAIFSYLFAESLDRAYRENRHRALHDELTGLPNRALFIDSLQQTLDRPDRNLCAVLFMDLDGFKVVNDSLGHKAGDELLVMTGQRLRTCLRRGDSAARFGGDEFAALVDNVVSVDEAVRAAERIAAILEAPFELRGREVVISTSVGIALSEGSDRNADTLLRNADVAMYEAKKKGNANYEVFSSDMHAEVLERLELENDLRHAINQGALKIYYQPKVELSTGRIIGMEALVRWAHPERGLISPEKFIPFAEEVGLIVPLGRWVLREACRQAYEWWRQYPAVTPLVTSVNLSIKQFKQLDLLQELSGLLQECKLDPQRLQLEITESTVTGDVNYAVDLLQKLRRLGIELAIDDFGTGYSSLMSLQQFPVNELKIDKVFIDGIGNNAQDMAIAKLVIDLAHAVGVRATAEGVETADQLVQLQSIGCDQAQGYYFCEPLSGDTATALLANTQRWLIDHHHPSEHSRNPGMLLERPGYSESE